MLWWALIPLVLLKKQNAFIPEGVDVRLKLCDQWLAFCLNLRNYWSTGWYCGIMKQKNIFLAEAKHYWEGYKMDIYNILGSD